MRIFLGWAVRVGLIEKLPYDLRGRRPSGKPGSQHKLDMPTLPLKEAREMLQKWGEEPRDRPCSPNG